MARVARFVRYSPDYSPAERIGRSSLGSSILGFPVFARPGLDGEMRRRVWGCEDGFLGAGTRPSAQVTNRARRAETTVRISSTGNTGARAIRMRSAVSVTSVTSLISLLRRVSNWATRQGDRFGMRLWNVQSSQ